MNIELLFDSSNINHCAMPYIGKTWVLASIGILGTIETTAYMESTR
jgi:hypothetical protein